MIVGELKPLEEIASSIKGFRNVFILGCGTCVTVCMTGGDKEANVLAHELRDPRFGQDLPEAFEVSTIERQCEQDILKAYLNVPDGCDAILSLACGAGVQTLAGLYRELPVIPALNTTFLGSLEEPGLWREQCRGCGDCMLAYTAGICPVTRCAKQIFNGPCGGSKAGKCEVDATLDCAWALILARLKFLNRLDLYEEIMPPKDWSRDRDGGPRKLRTCPR